MTTRTRILGFGAPAAGFVLLSTVLALGGSCTPSGNAPRTVTIATGTPGGTYAPIGNQFARILESFPSGERTTVESINTRGSRDNIELLTDSEATLAFIMRPALVEATSDQKNSLRLLARLYTDLVQIVARNELKLRDFTDLAGVRAEGGKRRWRIYIGGRGSATRLVAERLLASAGVNYVDSYPMATYAEAARLLSSERDPRPLDAAIFIAGIPTDSVTAALESGRCMLLSLPNDDLAAIAPTFPAKEYGISPGVVPASLYSNQASKVDTIGADVLLACRSDLDASLARWILETLFDNLSDLLLGHTRVKDIRFTTAFNPNVGPVPFHSAARRYWEEEQDVLLIATGELTGEYFNAGRMMRGLLKERGIPARVEQTDGSVENIAHLRDETRPAIALMQYDVALTARFGDVPVYGTDLYDYAAPEPALDVRVSNIRRLATLHTEKVHIVARRPEFGAYKEPDGSIPLRALRKVIDKRTGETGDGTSTRPVTISVGPERSGTQIISRALLKHLGIDPESVRIVHLSGQSMTQQLINGSVDLGFFTSYAPNKYLTNALSDPDLVLLSIGPRLRSRVVGPAFDPSAIPPGTYLCQLPEEPPVQTIATRAVLVATENLSEYDVSLITRAVFEGEALIRGKEADQNMAEDLPSLPLHPDAVAYYQEAGYLPGDQSLVTQLGGQVTVAWKTLAIIVVLVAAYRGLVEIRRRQTSKELGLRILEVSLDPDAPQSTANLRTLRMEIQERVQRRFWQRGELNWERWRHLHDLIEERIKVARENLTRSLIKEVHRITQEPRGSRTERQKQWRGLGSRIAMCFANGEIDAPQRSVLVGLLRESNGAATGAGS